MRARVIGLGLLGSSWYLVLLAGFLRQFIGLDPSVEYHWRLPAILFVVAGWAVYLWHVFNDPRVPADKRTQWAVILILAGPWASPFYFWFYVRDGAVPSAFPSIRP